MALQGDDKVTETQSAPLPVLEFIYFVKVHVISAHDLESSDLTGKSDPFCKVFANKQTWKTATIQKTLNPQWNEQTEFVFFDKPNEIKFEVFDEDKRSKADSIGVTTLDISQIYAADNQGFSGPLVLKDCKKGSIKVNVSGRLIKPLEMEQKCEQLEQDCKTQEQEIEDKKQRVQDLKSKNEEEQQKRDELQKEIDALKQEQAHIETQIANYKEENEQKKQRLEELNQKKQKYTDRTQGYERDIAKNEVQYGAMESKYAEQNDANKDLKNQYEAKQDNYEGPYNTAPDTYASNTSDKGLKEPLLPSGP